jgi:hypothetical protein
MALGQLRERILATFAPNDEGLLRRKRRKPWGTWRTIAAAVGGYLVVACWLAVGAVLALLVVAASERWAGFVIAMFTFTAIGPLMVVGSWLAGRRAAFRILLLGVVPLLAVGIGSGLAVPELILLARGHSVTAVITSADRQTNGRGSVYYDYTLRSVDGSAIVGQLVIGDSVPRPTGSRVQVVVDPARVAGPALADGFATTAEITTAVAAAGLALLAVIIGSVGIYGERQRRRWHRTR